MKASAVARGSDGIPEHRLDWGRRGLSERSRGVVRAFMEAMLADEGEDGVIVPGPDLPCARAVEGLDDSLGRGSADVRRGFAVVSLLMEWLPIFVIGRASRMSALPLPERLAYLEALEASRIGWLPMLLIAFKVPLTIPAFEEGEELALTGFDRPSLVARRLPVARDAAGSAGA